MGHYSSTSARFCKLWELKIQEHITTHAGMALTAATELYNEIIIYIHRAVLPTMIMDISPNVTQVWKYRQTHETPSHSSYLLMLTVRTLVPCYCNRLQPLLLFVFFVWSLRTEKSNLWCDSWAYDLTSILADSGCKLLAFESNWHQLF